MNNVCIKNAKNLTERLDKRILRLYICTVKRSVTDYSKSKDRVVRVDKV